jgi:hypothetical protein
MGKKGVSSSPPSAPSSGLVSPGDTNHGIDTKLGVYPSKYVADTTDDDTMHGKKMFGDASVHGDTVGASRMSRGLLFPFCFSAMKPGNLEAS